MASPIPRTSERVNIAGRLVIDFISSSYSATDALEAIDVQNDNLVISWQIMDYPESILKTKLDREESELEYSVLYKIKEFDKFSEYLETNGVIFRLNSDKNDSAILATGEVFMSRALRTLKSEVNGQVDLYHISVEEEKPILVGTLNIRYQLNSNIKSETELKMDRSIGSITTATFSLKSENLYSAEHETKKVSTISLTTINNEEVSESEVKKFQEDLFLVLNRDKALRTTQSEISRELRDRAEWLNEEAVWRRTLQENAILTGKNPFDVQWRQWRDVITSEVVLRSFPKKEAHYTPILEITIAQVIFFPSSTPYQNKEIVQIYVEYSFLHLEGPEMESDDTLPIPLPNKPAVFNFKKSFGINLKNDRRNCLLIAEMIKENISLKISVVSEPLPSYDVPIQTCEEIGYAEVNFFSLVQLDDNSSEIDYPILDSTSKDVIGSMKIGFSGILALRKMALLVLAPDGYDIIV